MNTVHVKTQTKAYDVVIGNGQLDNIDNYINLAAHNKILILSDSTVFKLYGDALKKKLQALGTEVSCFFFPAGENSKTLSVYGEILETLAEKQFTRTDAIFALGGGITGDIAGFAAATFKRGMDFYQLPTTLLAAVDSSVGGKTGVNLPSGKNLAGAFWQPAAVICDTKTFDTLSDSETANGIAEIIKYGMIRDVSLFNLMLSGDFYKKIEAIIAKCVKIKADIVGLDERDTGQRQLLNFGHTIGHAIEKCSNYKISHGHAVAIGMVLVTRASVKYGFCTGECEEKLVTCLHRYKLPVECDFTTAQLAKAAASDKKREGSKINLIVPLDLGECKRHEIQVDELEDFIKAGLGEANTLS